MYEQIGGHGHRGYEGSHDDIKLEKLVYTNPSGIRKLYNKWKKVEPIGRMVGRPPTMILKCNEEAVNKSSDAHTSNTNDFRLKDMKSVYEKVHGENADKNGLDPGSVDCSTSDQRARVDMIAVAMGDTDLTFSCKKLQPKTEKTWQTEHSVKGAYTYTTTILSAQFIEGSCPRKIQLKHDLLSNDAKETLEWVKEVYGTRPIILSQSKSGSIH